MAICFLILLILSHTFQGVFSCLTNSECGANSLCYQLACQCTFGSVPNSASPGCTPKVCRRSADCVDAFDHSRCDYFTKRCICDYGSILHVREQRCTAKEYAFDRLPSADSSEILQYLFPSLAVLFILGCLCFWTKIYFDYIEKRAVSLTAERRGNVKHFNYLSINSKKSLLGNLNSIFYLKSGKDISTQQLLQLSN